MSKTPVYLLLFMFFIGEAYALTKNAKDAIDKAASAKEYLFLTFYNEENSDLSSLNSSIKEFTKTWKKKIAKFDAKVSDPGNKDIVTKYGIQNSKDLPLLLVIAPNGVITGGFPKSFTTDKLKECVSVSDFMLNLLKSLQEQKVVLVAFQNKTTKLNNESWQGVNDFANDAQYKQKVTAIKCDPDSPEGKEFMKQCGITSPITEATVVAVRPPGQIGCVLKGKVTKADILKSLTSCASGC